MNSRAGSGLRISNIFFVSILAAASIYGMAASIESVSFGDLFPGLIIFAILASAIATTFILRIPSYFASQFSRNTISLLAIAISILGLLLAISDAATFVGLPEYMMTRPGVQSQRIVSFVGVASFSLALIVNVVAALIVPKQSADTSL